MKISDERRCELAKLAKLAKKGDHTAFGKIVELTQNSVHRFCYFLSQNREQADEFCQDTYLRAIDHFGSLTDENRLHEWLLSISKNLFLDYKRSPKNHSVSFDEHDSNHDLITDRNDTEIIEVRKALAQIDPDERALLILVDLEHYSYSEAARIFGITDDAVRSRIHRARLKFQKILEDRETKPLADASSLRKSK